MGLDAFKTDKEYEIGTVNSRKKVENIKLTKEQWKILAHHHPSMIEIISNQREKTEVKAIISAVDEVLENGARSEGISSEKKDALEETRSVLVERLKELKE